MKTSRLTASLVALVLFAVPAMAEDPVVTDQPATGQVQKIPDELRALLKDRRAATELSDDELRQRLQLAKSFMEVAGLPGNVKKRLQNLARQAQNELAVRQQAANQTERAAPALEPQVAAEQPATQEQPAVAAPSAELPPELVALLNDTRPASELSDAELKQRFSQARGFFKTEGLPKDVRQSLARLAKQTRGEIEARQQAQANQTTTTAETQPAVPAPETAPAGTQVPDDVMAFIQDDRPLSEFSNQELLARVQKARELSLDTKLPENTRAHLQRIARTSRLEALARKQLVNQPADDQQTQTPAAGDQQQAQVLDGNNADPAAEAEAKTFLDGGVQVEKLSDRELRTRLTSMRDLLAGNKLSQQTERALRMKLRAEREILRGRIALKQVKPGPPAAATDQDSNQGTINNNANVTTNVTNITNIQNVKVVLADRRPASQLADNELRLRINVYLGAVNDDRYDEQERRYWREAMVRDRQFLRYRLIEERRRRAADLSVGFHNGDFNFVLGLNFDPDRPPPRDIFAAEVDEADIEDVLFAPPRRRIERRYTVEEVESQPELRDALARIEIDTVHFGFGESFVREEEVANLDKIAEVMEKILTAHPREVFFIEGHTDAVGSAASNMVLSRLRAEAIKQALTTFYVIAPENLKTIGYGERFLKIPTAEAEAENRRVSIARATALVGELDN